MEFTDPRGAAVLNRFLRVYVSDRSRGHERTLQAYQALYPGFEELVAEEYSKLEGERQDAPDHESPWSPWRSGVRLGHYVLERELGRGGQGTVFLARDTQLDRRVAIKILTGLSSVSPDHISRFHREAALASRLDHPGICTVYESHTEANTPYVVMRYVEGETLARTLARARDARELPDVEWVLQLVEKAARALHVAHEAGVVHRDVKPGNLMLTPDGEPVVLDFGLARDLDGGQTVTGTGDVFGTPAYMAPEQIRGRSRPDRRTDVYALGVVLYEALTLELPFRAPTLDALYRKVLVERAPPARRRGASLSTDLAILLDTALEKDGERRYGSARDLAEDLRAVRESRPIAARPVSSLARAVRWARREPGKAVLASLLALALVSSSVLAGYLLARTPEIQAGEQELQRRERVDLVTAVFGSQFMASADELDAALAADPRNGSMRLAIGMLLRTRNQPTQALEVLDAAPPDGDLQRALARLRVELLQDIGRDEEAQELVAALGDPQDAAECWFLGRKLIYGDSTPEESQRGFALLERAVYLTPAPQQYFLDLIVACTDLGDVDKARMAERSLVQNYPDSALAWFSIAAARSLYDPAASREAIERSIELDGDFAQAHAAYSAHLVLAGEMDAAFDAHDRAMASTIGGPRERRDLRLSFAALLPAEHALQILDDVLAELPDDVDALACKAERLRELGETDWATEVIEQALLVDPDHPRVRALTGR